MAENIHEKLSKEENKLQGLLEQKAILDEKIKKSEEKIEEYNQILNQKKFNEFTSVLHAKGLSVEEIMDAVQKGDLLALQERMEEKIIDNTMNSEKE